LFQAKTGLILAKSELQTAFPAASLSAKNSKAPASSIVAGKGLTLAI